MIPLPLRVAVPVIGAAMLLGSFAVRSSVDRGLQIRHDTPPPLTTDAGLFSLRVLGAFILTIGLLLSVASRSLTSHH